jgi:hypothetical protein
MSTGTIGSARRGRDEHRACCPQRMSAADASDEDKPFARERFRPYSPGRAATLAATGLSGMRNAIDGTARRARAGNLSWRSHARDIHLQAEICIAN